MTCAETLLSRHVSILQWAQTPCHSEPQLLPTMILTGLLCTYACCHANVENKYTDNYKFYAACNAHVHQDLGSHSATRYTQHMRA